MKRIVFITPRDARHGFSLSSVTQFMHRTLYALRPYERLSGQVSIAWWRLLHCS